MSDSEKLDKLVEKVDRIHDRLFVDNGKASMQTLLARHDDQLRSIGWVVKTVVAAVIGIVVALIFEGK